MLFKVGIIIKINNTFFILSCIFFLSLSHAQDIHTTAYYHITNWHVKNDLGEVTIGDVTINASGHLIVATGMGLKIFDGENFRDQFSYSTEIERNGITRIVNGKNREIWGVNQYNLFKFTHQNLISYEIPIKYNIYNSLVLLDNIVPWVVSQFKLKKFVKEEFVDVNNSLLATAIAKSFQKNHLWIGSKGSIIKINKEGVIKQQSYFKNEATIVLAMLESSDGTMWISTSHGIYQLNDELKKFKGLDQDIRIRKFFQDSRDNIWILTNHGVYVYQDNLLKKINIKDNRELRVRGMVEDKYGNLWFGTWGKGLFRLKQSDFNIITQGINPSSYMQTPDGTSWIGSFNGLNLLKGKIKTEIKTPEIKNKLVFDAEEGLLGNVWVAFLNKLLKFKKNSENYEIVTEIDALVYRFLLKDQNKRLWVGTDNGLFYKDLELNNKFEEFVFPTEEIIKMALEVDDNKLLFITNKNAYIYSNQQLRQNNLTKIIVPNYYTISYDDLTKTVWYFNPKEHKLVQYSNGITHDYYLSELLKYFTVYNVVADVNEDLLLLGEKGIIRIRKSWLDQYNREEQLNQTLLYEMLAIPVDKNSECNSGHRSIVKNNKGNLVFTCKGIILELKPKNKSTLDNTKQKTVINDITFDGELFEYSNGRHIFSPETVSYDFIFASNSLNEILPLKYRYKLHGLDANWRYLDKNTSVTYVKLKPGSYSFEVQVKSSKHDWESTKYGKMNLTVKKYFYQENSFKVLLFFVIVFLAMILVAIYDYFRNKRLISHAKRLTLLVEEKTHSLKEVQKRELEYEKISKEVLNEELARNTSKLTKQMKVILNQEKQIRETQKMEVVGQLTSGIAHDFNNMLSIIFIGADVIKKNLLAQEGASNVNQQDNIKWLDKVLQASENCKDVIGQLLHFSRNKVDTPKVIDVNQALEDIVSLIKVSLPDTLSLSIKLMKDQGLIKANIGQFNQIILNLIINARDACDDYGNIEINTSKIYIDNGICASCHNQVKGKFVEVCIKDNGTGIPKAIQSKIFKPFFTSKDNNIGSGIGLNVVDSNIHNMHGHVLMESKVNIGTVFRLLIPLSHGLFKEMPIRKNNDDLKPPNRDIHILLIEDSVSLVDLICLILKEANISADIAVDGIEGKALFVKNPKKYDIIITDNSMPRLNGLDMSRKILDQYPETKIILLTGDVTEQVVKEANDLGILEILHKPIRADDLVEIVYKYVE